jgi:hypothetical protein
MRHLQIEKCESGGFGNEPGRRIETDRSGRKANLNDAKEPQMPVTPLFSQFGKLPLCFLINASIFATHRTENTPLIARMGRGEAGYERN